MATMLMLLIGPKLGEVMPVLVIMNNGAKKNIPYALLGSGEEPFQLAFIDRSAAYYKSLLMNLLHLGWWSSRISKSNHKLWNLMS
jgi:hypothetical protein